VIVALGPGDADGIPVGSLRVLARAGTCDVRGPAELRAALAREGVVHADGAPIVAAPDLEAWLLARGQPARETTPARAALAARGRAAALAELWSVTERLRRDCPWDREQTAATIVPHTLEEAYEVAEKALAGPPDAALVDELGDLLFQVYFLALLADEAGAGDLADVAEAIRAKLVRRHPHVFGDAVARDAHEVRGRWEQLKREQEGREGIFHDVPGVLPALLHARKLQRRAAAVGFDWASADEAWPALPAELAELREALDAHGVAGEGEPHPDVRHEAGDLLFSAVNVLRLAGVDPELALRGASARFRARVEAAEELAAAAGDDFRALGLDVQEGYYRAAKAREPPDRPPAQEMTS
jgi:XTP/dITP diphosphohydrolase/tetrapyrrole methylase family protein/MazG family protein/ATP diphosphatase